MDSMTLSSISSDDKLHIVMFPWLAFGHMIPFLELAKLIAQKGHRVSYISTPRNIDRLPKLPTNISHLISFVKLSLPHVEKLPQNAEATTDLPLHQIPYLKKAYEGLEDALSSFLESSTPDWIIYDLISHWLPPITARLRVLGVYFFICGPWTLASFGSTSEALMNGDDPRTEPEHFTVPPEWVPFPTNLVFRLHEAKRLFIHYEVDDILQVSDTYCLGSAVAGCDVLAVRSCLELKPEWLKLLEEIHQKPVFPVGLLPPCLQASRGDIDKDDDTWLTISEWLNKQKEESVVFIALGSELDLSQEELTELALGVELSGLPFFWALRIRKQHEHGKLVQLPDGFEDRTKGRGVVWTSWAPQLRILAHDSVGGFLTHCGWSSVIEGLHFGRALILLPFVIDQGLIARLMVEMKVGLEIPRNEQDGSFTRNLVANSIRLVMVDEEGKTYKDGAKEARKLLFGDKDREDQYIHNFVQYLQDHKLAK